MILFPASACRKKAEISGLRLSFGPIEKRRAPAEAPRTEKQV
jgi:hypothetical protein